MIDMKQTIYIITIITSLMIISCNKNKQSSKTLQGTTWKFTSLKIGGVIDSSIATLKFNEGNIYNEVLTGAWLNQGNTQAETVIFAWQFRDKGKTFELSNQSDGDDAIQCSELTGIYTVDELTETTMKINTTSALGHVNKKVEIVLAKQSM